MTIGRDGCVNIFPASLSGEEATVVRLFHHQRGGVKTADVLMADDNSAKVLCTDWHGSLQFFSGRGENAELMEPRKDVPAEDAFVTFLFSVAEKAAVPDAKAWSAEKLEEETATERLNYEETIADIEASLTSMRSQVDHLLDCNDELPEKERLDRTDFELNSEEKQKRIQQGLQKEASLQLELKAWQLARKKVGLAVRREIWDDMEVKGRCIKARRWRELKVHVLIQ